MFLDLFVIAISGAIGAVVRYLSYAISKAIAPDLSSWVVTLVINISGCLLIGITMVLVERAVPFHRHLFLIGVVGFIGSFTTFSTFGGETLALIQSGRMAWAIFNIGAQVIFGVTAVWVGRSVTHWLA